jgi:hypothetical protein
MQILHLFAGSVQQYLDQLDDWESPRPRYCPQCSAKQPLTAHGFYIRTIVDAAFDGAIRIRRYLCKACHHTVSLLPEFALPYLRSSLAVIAWRLMAHFLPASPPPAPPAPPAPAPAPPAMPYQRGQFWLRRFRRQAESLCAALAAVTTPSPAPNFVERALGMLTAAGWTPAHRFLFTDLRQHLLGWPPSLAPAGLRVKPGPVSAPA